MRVGVFGATGQVGRVMLKLLDERGFPVDELRAFSSARSAGSTVSFRGTDVTVIVELALGDLEVMAP